MCPDFFNPGPNPHGNPPIFLAAVGERMTAVASRVADCMLCHSFTTETYLQLNTLSRGQQWAEMGTLITDDVLDAFSISSAPAEVAATVRQRYGDIVDRISL